MSQGFLKDNEHYLVALTLAGVLVLLYKAMKDSNLKLAVPVANEGFLTGSALANLSQEFSQPGQDGRYTRSDRHDPSGTEGMWPHEPPVFWNAGDYAASRAATIGSDAAMGDMIAANEAAANAAVEAAALAAEAAAKEGLYGGRRRAGYVDGMQNRFSDASLAGIAM